MPIHDWTRVNSGTFHDFHSSWITHIKEALNGGLLPRGYYAQSEQVVSRRQTDVLTLSLPPRDLPHPVPTGGVASVVAAPPQVHWSLRPDPKHKPRRPTPRGRRLLVRHNSGHQVVALLEIVSPSNKDRRDHVREIAVKVVNALESDIHALLVDLLPPGRHDPHGIHGAVWAYFDTRPPESHPGRPLTAASYVWDGQEPLAYVEPLAVGQRLTDMPLFLTADLYVKVPLEATYAAAFRGIPEFFRELLEAPPPAPQA